MDSIFINYRRADSAAGYSRSLAQALRAQFGDSHVFRDIKGIPPGENFPEVISQKLSNCRVMLVLIGSQWIRLTDSSGKRRLDNPQDWVRREIVTALEREILVIPILVNGAPMPAAVDLPDDIVKLATRNAFTMSDDDWDHDLTQLVRALSKHLGLQPKAVSSPGSNETFLDVLAKAIPNIPQAVKKPQRRGLPSRLLFGLLRRIRTLAVIALLVWVGYTQSTEFAAGVDRFLSQTAQVLSRLLP